MYIPLSSVFEGFGTSLLKLIKRKPAVSVLLGKDRESGELILQGLNTELRPYFGSR
jgi:hypothetical protein